MLQSENTVFTMYVPILATSAPAKLLIQTFSEKWSSSESSTFLYFVEEEKMRITGKAYFGTSPGTNNHIGFKVLLGWHALLQADISAPRSSLHLKRKAWRVPKEA